jgi:hypothetical protein
VEEVITGSKIKAFLEHKNNKLALCCQRFVDVCYFAKERQ